MNLQGVIFGPWAITDDAYEVVQEVYDRHVRGEAADLPKIEAAIGRPLDSRPPAAYDLIDGVATIHLEGVLAKRMNLFTAISGGTSTEIFRSQLAQALAASDVRGIILAIDSPGGTVDGMQQASDAVFAARGVKPIVTVADGMIASSAYDIGSAAARVFLADTMTIAGSIGVKGQHVDRSGADAAAGIKRTTLRAGKYKAVGDDTKPLSDDDKAILEAHLNEIYTAFVDSVARNLAMAPADVLARIAEGRLFVGRQAVDAGLAHGIATIDQVRARMIAGEFRIAGAPKAQATRQESRMDIAELKAQHPDLVAQIETAARADGEAAGRAAGKAEGEAAGRAAELQRIKDIEAQALPGHEALIAQLKFDGKTTGAEAAVQILAAERTKLAGVRDNLRSDAGAAAVPSATTAPAPPAASGGEPPASATEEQLKAAWDKDSKLRAEFGDSFDRYKAFAKANHSGSVRVLEKRAAA